MPQCPYYSSPCLAFPPLQGWHDVLRAIQSTDEGKANLKSWWSDPTILERIEKLHADFPAGFKVTPAPPPPLQSGASATGQKMRMKLSTMSLLHAHDDLDTREMGYYVEAEVRGEINARWKRVRAALKMHAMLQRVSASSMDVAAQS